MPAITCDPRFLFWGGSYRGTFRPEGRLEVFGETPPLRHDAVQLAARFIVRLTERPGRQLADIVALVRGPQNRPVVTQPGELCMGRDPAAPAAQIFMFGRDSDEDAFQRETVAIAETLARTLEQEIVPLQLQRDGQFLRILLVNGDEGDDADG